MAYLVRLFQIKQISAHVSLWEHKLLELNPVLFDMFIGNLFTFYNSISFGVLEIEYM